MVPAAALAVVAALSTAVPSPAAVTLLFTAKLALPMK
jgi:hypothetical protein